MASAPTSWSEDNFSCPICLDVFNSPVFTPCGHNFCKTCITKFWDEQVGCKCPVCNEVFRTEPDLRVNTFISEMVNQFKSCVRVQERPLLVQSEAAPVRVQEQGTAGTSPEPGEVLCDVCTGTQLMAVKSCLVCLISYCRAHLEPHQRVAVLKRHQLVDPRDRLEDRMCKKHDRLLEFFCPTDQVCVCQFCAVTDHKSHPVVTLKEEYEVKRVQLEKMESEVKQMIQERQLKIQEIKDTVDLSKADADREIADGVQVLAALMQCIKKCQDDLKQTVTEKLKSTEKQAEGLIKELEQEIEDLIERRSEVKQLSYTEDHLRFLQTFTSLENPHTRDWTTVNVHPQPVLGTLTKTLDQLEETLNKEMKLQKDAEQKRLQKLCDTELKRVQLYEVDVTLDPDTAHPHLNLSENGKQVHDENVGKKLPCDPKRFTQHLYVLTRQSFSSGRCYFEVQVKDKTGWMLGVARESAKRKDFALNPENGYWVLVFNKTKCISNDNTAVSLPVRAKLQKVGVFVDYEAGLVSFYDVEAQVLIHSATACTFSEPLYPILSPGYYYCGMNSAPLIISPVKQTN